MNKLKYLNNERRLYEYIENHLNEDNLLVTNDQILADKLNVTKITVLRWRKRLVGCGLIQSLSKHIGGKKSLVLRLNKIEEREI